MLWIPLDNLRQALRVEIRDDDAELARLVKASRDYIEHRTGLTLGTATKRQYLNTFKDCLLEGAPNAINPVIVYEKSGAPAVLPGTDYKVRYTDGPLSLIVFDTDESPDYGTVDITYTCGFGNAVPHDLMQAGIALVAHWYTNVEAAAPVDLRPVPFSAEVILQARSVRSALR
jgi:uncharacterized phiE125 gp8 family phage protein